MALGLDLRALLEKEKEGQVPQAEPIPVAPPPVDVMGYIRALSEKYQAARAQDEEENRFGKLARGFESAAGAIRNRPPDYTGLEPTDRNVRAIGQQMGLESAGMEQAGKLQQYAMAAQAADPRSAASLIALRTVMNDPNLGPQFRAEHQGVMAGVVPATYIQNWVAARKSGLEAGKDVATIGKDTATARNLGAEAQTKEGLNAPASPAQLDFARANKIALPAGATVGQVKDAVEAWGKQQGVAVDWAKLGLERDKFEAEKGTKATGKAQDLRKEFQGRDEVKRAQLVKESMTKVMTADASPAGDIALVYGFMKLVDPGSTVREGEFATAANAGGVSDKITSLYNRVIQGERLPQAVREDFKRQAGAQFQAQLQTYWPVAKEFSRIATEQGMNPEDVVLDLGFGPEKAPPAGAGYRPSSAKKVGGG